MKFKYIKPNIEYKDDAIDYIKETIEFGSDINGVGGLDRYLDDYEGWLIYRNKSEECEPSEEKVPGGEYFMVDEENEIIGMCNIRYCLNSKLKERGGNIGYSIRPSKRGNGYNKINLYLALKVCKEKGIKEAMLTAYEDNPASWKTMEALGGKLDRIVDFDNKRMKVYYINVEKSLEQNKDKYEMFLI